jgi:ABC-type multidrug transport system fused ATPase/permease subunit
MFFVEILVVFVALFLTQYILVVNKNKKFNEKKAPKEMLFLLRVYKLDINKINYKKSLIAISIINSLIMTITFTLIIFISGLLLQLILAFFILVPFVFISYSLLGKYYQKRGMTKIK